MAYLNMNQRFGPNKTHRTFSQGPKRNYATDVPGNEPTSPTVLEMENMVQDGKQYELAEFFKNWQYIPTFLGEWRISINEQKLDDQVVARVITALPQSMRTQRIFEAGCKKYLADMGFSHDDAEKYYLGSRRKKYAWITPVMQAIKEMISSYTTTVALERYLEFGTKGQELANDVQIPKNPYKLNQSQFTTACEIAIFIINGRIKSESDQKKAA